MRHSASPMPSPFFHTPLRALASLAAAAFALSCNSGTAGDRSTQTERSRAVAAATSASATPAGSGADGYAPPLPVGSYPSPQARIQQWINQGNTSAIRAHAWDIWASITAATSDKTQPTWQTWYSGHELFEMDGGVRLRARAPRGRVEFEAPVMFGHRPALARPADGSIPYDPAERVFAFNRFTQSTASFIWQKHLWSGDFLRDTNNAFTKRGTPLVSRAILTSRDSTDSASFVIKTVFQFISGSEVTAVPYWAGDSAAVTTEPLNPIPAKWRQAVAVDPSGKHQPGDSVFLPVNNDGPKWLKVVPMSAFYWIRITAEDSAHLSMFGAANGDFIGVANDTSLQAVMMAVRPGNVGLLMAMHVTGKEIPNWTWQTFWWGFNPQDSAYGRDRPATIPAPWNHYNMNVAYSMVTPEGKPLVAFNPYLETSLAGVIPNGRSPKDSLSWTGVTTNCMSCHRRAAWGWADGQYIPQLYGPAANVDPGDPVIFTQPVPGGPPGKRVPLLKTDFLWSIVVRAHPPTSGAVVPVKQ